MNEQKFTVFSEGEFAVTSGNEMRPQTLDGLMVEMEREMGRRPVCWAPEALRFYGGTKMSPVLYAESIAAGRIIKQIDGKWVAFGAEPQPPMPDRNAIMRLMLDAVALATKQEPLRKPLTWNTPASTERFPGFSVQSETHPDEPTPVHALQRLAEGDPRCGSAWLLGR